MQSRRLILVDDMKKKVEVDEFRRVERRVSGQKRTK
jgi:hypothetical protein